MDSETISPCGPFERLRRVLIWERRDAASRTPPHCFSNVRAKGASPAQRATFETMFKQRNVEGALAALKCELSVRRLTLGSADVEVGRVLHYMGVKMGQMGQEHEFEAISALEEALSNIQDSVGPGEEESAVIAHNLWVLLHNVRARHESLMKQTSRNFWKSISTDIMVTKE